jgi:DNA-binding response OmpR family regulator
VENGNILVVDNDESLLHVLQLYLAAAGYEVHVAQSAAEALDMAAAHPPSVALLDRILDPPLRRAPLPARRAEQVERPLTPARRRGKEAAAKRVPSQESTPALDGLTLARQLRRTDPSPPIILMTAHATIQSAWEAGQLGVYYLTKPFALQELTQLLTTILRERRTRPRRSRPPHTQE